MAKNVERILNKLQSLCDEKAAECTSDFAQHESWLLGTFKSNALRQLTRSKVELACPTSAKKQKTSEEPAEPTPADEVEPADMQVDAPEEAAPKELEPAPVAAPDPGAAAKLAAAMAAANIAADQPSPVTEVFAVPPAELAAPHPSSAQPAATGTESKTRTPVAASAQPPKSALISPDSPVNKKPSATGPAEDTRPSQAKPQPNPAPQGVGTAAQAPVPTPGRTISATEQLLRLRQRLAGYKTGQTPIQPVQSGTRRQQPADEVVAHPASVAEVHPKPAPAAAPGTSSSVLPVGAATANGAAGASATTVPKHTEVKMEDAVARPDESEVAGTDHATTASREAETRTVTEQQQQQSPPDMKKSDMTQKRDVTQVEHAETDPVSKKTKLVASSADVVAPSTMASTNEPVTGATASGTTVTSVVPQVQTDKPKPEQNDSRTTAQASQGSVETNNARTTAAPASAVAVEDKLAMAAARRQQMENERLQAQRAKSPVSTMDQSKKRSHPQDADAAQKRPKAPSATPAGSENRTVGTDKVLMPPPPPSASKKTPLKSPSSTSNTNANSYATEMKPTAPSSAAAAPVSASSSTTTSSSSTSSSTTSSSSSSSSSSSTSAAAKASSSSATAKPSSSAAPKAAAAKEQPKKVAKKVPEWAQGATLQQALRGEQMYRDPDEIFGPVEMTCNLQEIFSDKTKSKYSKKRSSSGNWVPDRTTYQEEKTYKKLAGYR